MAKPDKAVFRTALQIVGVQPERSFFIDDRTENVQAAEELGMRAHLYENVESLRRALRAEGIILTVRRVELAAQTGRNAKDVTISGKQFRRRGRRSDAGGR